ncbi:MAG: hypothetical protein ACXIUM_10650 [Wenzhouxiangella sp.]
MGFSIFEISAVLLEVIRPLLPLLIILLIFYPILLIVAFKRGTLGNSSAIRLAALFGGIAAVITIFIAPSFTASSFANLKGALDYLSLVGGALAVGVLVALLTWPSVALFQRS